MALSIRNASSILRLSVRSFATVTPSQVASTSSGLTIQTPTEHNTLRPHLNIPVNPNHGLYGFFRMKTDQNSHSKPRGDGQPEYIALEAPTTITSGRAWNAAELRRKSFKDLHTLWYVLLRERNLLATQKEEKRKVNYVRDPTASRKALNCRKSMARIKAVISERRHAYQHAARLRRVLSRRPELQEEPAILTENGGEGGLLEAEHVVAEKTP